MKAILKPKSLPRTYESKGQPKAQAIFQAFKGTELKHRPRSPDKAEWLAEQGWDPEKPFGSASP